MKHFKNLCASCGNPLFESTETGELFCPRCCGETRGNESSAAAFMLDEYKRLEKTAEE